MAILLQKETKVLIQGITGHGGARGTERMLEYGTKVVAGVTPGRGGEVVMGVPVYDTVAEAIENHGNIDFSWVTVPAPLAKMAVLEALDGGIKHFVLYPERLPQQEMLEIIEYAREKEAIVIGPNSIGVMSPGRAVIGTIGGTIELKGEVFTPGNVGVISRSGGMTTSTAYAITKAGMGESTVIGIGGDAFVGTTILDLLPHFERDEETKALVLFGEIGTSHEENASEYIKSGKFTKPVIAYIAGRNAKEGMRFGHAGAIIEGGKGTVASKINALRDAGVHVAKHFPEIGKLTKEALKASRR